ncbi:MAG: hypothetical protein WAQ27_00710 [Candidatus Microsaccharimonas sp.]
MTNHKDHTRTIVNIGFITASVFAMFVALIALFVIYQNNKTDGLNNGQITVSSCQEKDWAWRIYSCKGFYFSTGGGMVERNDVSVTAFGREYKKGDIIPDVYPPAFSDNQTTDHFITGRERASVNFNAPWLAALFIGILLPIVTVFVLIINRPKKKLTANHHEA